jgi:RNA polymerase sigma-54 factor
MAPTMIAQHELATATVFGLHASPALVQFSQTLALSALGLEEAIERELAANPALERRPVADPGAGAAPRADDIADTVADEPSDGDRLLAAARLFLPAAEHELAEAAIGSLNSRGFLPAPLDELAAELGCSRRRLERVVDALREAGPPGTAADGLRGCLLAQLDALGAGDARHAVARAIVADHLAALAAGQLRAIARALAVDQREVAAARDLIRTRLRPCAVMERPLGRRPSAVPPPPELAFRRSGRGGHDVEVLEADRLALRVSRQYSEAAFSGGPREAAALSADLRRAHAFLGRLEERWRALRALGEALALHQDAFLRHGPEHLRPLTRAQIARELGVHESTVSRSVAAKHAALPNGCVVPLSDFFMTSHDALDALRDLVASEPRPLPDAVLAEAMRRRGFPIARRTVAKYRGSLGIPPVSRCGGHRARP